MIYDRKITVLSDFSLNEIVAWRMIQNALKADEQRFRDERLAVRQRANRPWGDDGL
jgi:hypothetical protein